ncbi:uncharacterized protein LOC6649186 [Drosophila willistoni]|nr:uncharacterized protein LOC6649186 [Drosophila willistoni]
MLLSLMLHRYSVNGKYTSTMDWSEPPMDLYNDESLMLILGLSVCTQLVLMVYITMTLTHSNALRRKQYNEMKRRHYGNFIFRRLLAQLDQAWMSSSRCADLDACRLAQCQALDAIHLFRHSAIQLLYPEFEMHSEQASDAYWVLNEQELELSTAGYAFADISVEVTDDLLVHLVHPERTDGAY